MRYCLKNRSGASESTQYETDHSKVDAHFARGAQPLIVFAQPPVGCQSGEGALDGPAPRDDVKTGTGATRLQLTWSAGCRCAPSRSDASGCSDRLDAPGSRQFHPIHVHFYPRPFSRRASHASLTDLIAYPKLIPLPQYIILRWAAVELKHDTTLP
jgi:hypothetical protein